MEGEAQYSVGFETGRRYQVHKSYYLLGPILATVVILVIGAANGTDGLVKLFLAYREGRIGINPLLVIGLVILAVIVIYLVVFLLYRAAYRKMAYAFDEGEFSFYSGIIARREVHLPYARIQSVNHRASILQRVSGVCTVTIDSAGGASNKAVKVPYVRLATAERLRTDLYVRKAAAQQGIPVVYDPSLNPDEQFAAQGGASAVKESVTAARPAKGTNVMDSTIGVAGEWRGAFGGAYIDGLEEPSFKLGLSNRELFLTGATHSVSTVLGMVGALGAFLTSIPVFIAAHAPVWLGALILPLEIILVIVVAVVFWLISVLSTSLAYGGFTVLRRGSRVEVSQGLLQRRFTGIDVSRIQYVQIRQNFLTRLMGYCELSVGRVASSEQNSSGKNKNGSRPTLIIHPFIKLDRADEVLAGLIPEIPAQASAELPGRLSARAKAHMYLRHLLYLNPAFYIAVLLVLFFVCVLLSPAIQAEVGKEFVAFLAIVGLILIALCLLFTGVMALYAKRRLTRSGYEWGRDSLTLRKGGFGVTTFVIPRGKIQAGCVRTSAIQRAFGISSLVAITAAGVKRTSLTLADLSDEAAGSYLEWLRPRLSTPQA